MSRADSEMVCLCAVAGAHGIGGEVILKTFTEVPEDVAAYGPLQTENGCSAFEIAQVRYSGKKLIARLSGVADRTTAEALKGTRLYVERNVLPETDEDEWYHADLIGMRCETKDGTKAGTLKAIYDFGAGDVLEIVMETDGETVLLPFTAEAVPQIDIKGGRIVIDPPHEVEGEREESKNVPRQKGRA